MLAVSGGRLVCLSTPYGKRGFLDKAWADGDNEWKRIEIPASQISRITPGFLEEERRNLGESWFRQEYCCSFEALEGLVYPHFKRYLLPSEPGVSATGVPRDLANGTYPGRPVGGSTDLEASKTETPEDNNNHALAALRYLISHLDSGKLGGPSAPLSAKTKPRSWTQRRRSG
jgi:hypothetical protein